MAKTQRFEKEFKQARAYCEDIKRLDRLIEISSNSSFSELVFELKKEAKKSLDYLSVKNIKENVKDLEAVIRISEFLGNKDKEQSDIKDDLKTLKKSIKNNQLTLFQDDFASDLEFLDIVLDGYELFTGDVFSLKEDKEHLFLVTRETEASNEKTDYFYSIFDIKNQVKSKELFLKFEMFEHFELVGNIYLDEKLYNTIGRLIIENMTPSQHLLEDKSGGESQGQE